MSRRGNQRDPARRASIEKGLGKESIARRGPGPKEVDAQVGLEKDPFRGEG